MRSVFKTAVLTAFLLLVLNLNVFGDVDTVKGVYPFQLLGNVREEVLFDVTIRDDLLPFDLDGQLVKYNTLFNGIPATENTAAVPPLATGIIIGTLKLISNSSNFTLTISHTPLKWRDPENNNSTTGSTTSNTMINYRLYLITDVQSQRFVSGVDAFSISGSEYQLSNGSVQFVDNNLYVTLDEGTHQETEDRLLVLNPGMYESDIVFTLTAGSGGN